MSDMKKIGITSVITLLVLVLISCAASCSIEPIIYHTYEGPIFPLSSVSGAEGIVVERIMELDFSSYEHTVPGETMVPFNEARKTYVNDIYVLNNTTSEDITVEAVYPFVYALDEKKEWIPEIRVDGAVVETRMAFGRPVSEQKEMYMNASEEAKMALAGTLNVTTFERIASDEAYLNEALVGAPEASDVMGVYEQQRVMYVLFDVIVPAGESVRVYAEYEKQAGHGIYETDEHLDRYDILEDAYSALEITSSVVTAVGSEKWMAVEGENGVEAFLHP